MLIFPQLSSGSVAQYPFSRKYTFSSVTNLQEDASRFQSGMTSPVQLGWILTYSHLNQAEIDTLMLFFENTTARMIAFTFLDPLTNLLSWSEDLSQPVWAKSPLLTTATSTDSEGYTVNQLLSSAAGSNQLSQILQCPATALVCFSVYARADQPVTLTLSVDGLQSSFSLTGVWKQYSVTESGTGTNESKLITLSIDGEQAQVSRLTISGQPGPGIYTVTKEISGVRPRTRFDQDSLLIIAQGEDDFSCEVRLTSPLT